MKQQFGGVSSKVFTEDSFVHYEHAERERELKPIDPQCK